MAPKPKSGVQTSLPGPACGNTLTTPMGLPGEFLVCLFAQNLAGYSPQGRKVLDKTEAT